MVNPVGPFNPQLLRNMHNHDDVDSAAVAHHHTLGVGATQAFPGVRGKRLEDLVDENDVATLALIAALQAELDATQDELADYKDRIGSCIHYGGTASGSVSSGGAAPYTAVSGFTTNWGDPAVGLSYLGSGVFACTVSGTYLVETSLGLAFNGTGRRIIFWYKNGTASTDQYRRLQISAAGGAGNIVKPTVMRLVAGDQVHLRFFQDSGAGLNIQQSGSMFDNGSDWSRIVSITALR